MATCLFRAPGLGPVAARLGHGVLYAFMIGTPVIGRLTLGASGKVIPFFDMRLPALIGTHKNLGELLDEFHRTIGTAGYCPIALHAAAALSHHHVRRDSTLVRMLPMLDRRGRRPSLPKRGSNAT